MSLSLPPPALQYDAQNEAQARAMLERAELSYLKQSYNQDSTFTPAVTGSTSGAASSTDMAGRYLRRGNLVHVGIRFASASKGSLTGTIQVELPFVAASVANFLQPGLVCFDGLASMGSAVMVLVTAEPGQAYCTLRKYAITGSPALLTDANLSSSFSFDAISLTYEADPQ